jgi:hypothetical protein
MRTQKNHPRLFGTGPGWVALLCLAVLAWTGIAAAQLPAPGTPWSFDVDGFIQEAKLDGTAAAGSALQGGHIKVNGHMIVVPASTIVVLPGNQLTWQELFAQAPAPYGPTQSGMAAADLPAPIVQYEAHVIGNVLPANGTGCTIFNCNGEYVAGLIYISQQATNSGTGYINFIDYTNGELLVGGTPGSNLDGTRVRLNDPTGAFGRANAAGSTDPRFSVASFHQPVVGGPVLDSGNPTIRSVTGFPMCLPRTDPAVAGDLLCPESQRPVGAVGTITTTPAGIPSSFTQAPFEVGDYVTFAGTLVQDCALTSCLTGGPTAGPYPVPSGTGSAANTFISAHTIVNNFAIYTAPGTDPAYLAIDVALMGTGGTTVLGLNEAAIRTRFEGFTTDVSDVSTQRHVHLYGVDLACNGTESGMRDWGTISVDPGPPTGAAKGRWRFRPPCTGVAPTQTAAGTVTDKVCSPPAAGVFDPPPRDVRAILEVPASTLPSPTGTPAIPSWVLGQTTQAAGVVYGQAHVPIGDYIFPEQVVGNPVPPDNFETMAFLVNGGVSSTTGTLALQLSPFPTVPVPTSSCSVLAAPTVTASANVTAVTSGGVVNLTATATGTPAPTLTWAQIAGTPGTFSSTLGPAVAWTAPVVALTETATFQVTAANGVLPNATSSVSVTVNPAAAPTITSVTATPTTATAGTVVALSATATGPNPITFTWAQTAGTPGTFGSTTGSPVNWTAPSVTLTETATFTVTATDTVTLLSASAPVSITVNPTVFPPIVAHVPPQTVNSAATVTLTVTATSTDPVFNTNAAAMLTLNVTTNPVITPINIALPPAKTCTIAGCTFVWTVTFTAPTIAPAQPNQTIQVSITATDTFVTPNLTSATEFTTVTVTAPADTISITSVEDRQGKQRVILNVTDATPGVVLKVQPYVCSGGVTACPASSTQPVAGVYDPCKGVGCTLSPNGAGLWIITMVGAPKPVCKTVGETTYATPCNFQPPPMTVKSNLGGTSPASEVTKIRQ